jgi:hypothetical protein
MAFLNQAPPTNTVIGTTNLNQALNGASKTLQQIGSIASIISSADGNGLPSSQVPALLQAVPRRNIGHWFVPEVGVINMYINPQNIDYGYKKVINTERTKGGYNIQYWGEELPTLTLQGHTGSSGVEGLNVLYEIYRAEQYLFDPIALTMASDSSITGLNSSVDSVLGNLGGFNSSLTGGSLGVMALDPASQNILPQNVPSLASLALGIEFYYTGWVFRGFFTSMTVNESVDKLGLFTYNIAFMVTQRRGYRTNSLAWQRSANSGPSNSDAVPLSFSDLQTANSFNSIINAVNDIL